MTLRQKPIAKSSWDEKKLFKKLTKTFGYLRDNPRQPGLETHEVKDLSKRYGVTGSISCVPAPIVSMSWFSVSLRKF